MKLSQTTVCDAYYDFKFCLLLQEPFRYQRYSIFWNAFFMYNCLKIILYWGCLINALAVYNIQFWVQTASFLCELTKILQMFEVNDVLQVAFFLFGETVMFQMIEVHGLLQFSSSLFGETAMLQTLEVHGWLKIPSSLFGMSAMLFMVKIHSFNANCVLSVWNDSNVSSFRWIIWL